MCPVIVTARVAVGVNYKIPLYYDTVTVGVRVSHNLSLENERICFSTYSLTPISSHPSSLLLLYQHLVPAPVLTPAPLSQSLSRPLHARLLSVCSSIAYLSGDAIGAVKCLRASVREDQIAGTVLYLLPFFCVTFFCSFYYEYRSKKQYLFYIFLILNPVF